MPFITWTQANRVGVELVDDQHKSLFDILNRLHAAVSEGKEQGELFAVLDELIEYTVYHFEVEEGLAVEHGYPEHAGHKAEHDKLTARALELQAGLRDGSATLSFELLDFLYNWLMDHTMGIDRELGSYLNHRGVC